MTIQHQVASVAPGTWRAPAKQNCGPDRGGGGPLARKWMNWDAGGAGAEPFFFFFLSPKIFEMMDAKARQDCVKEIGLLKVSAPSRMHPCGQAPLWTDVLSPPGTGLTGGEGTDTRGPSWRGMRGGDGEGACGPFSPPCWFPQSKK